MDSDDLRPPLAWEIHGANGPNGDVTWKGNRELVINTGPNLRVLLEKSTEAHLASNTPGKALSRFFDDLRKISGGAAWAKAVPRDVVMSTLRWNAAADADGSPIEQTDAAARYKQNQFPPGFDTAKLLAWTEQGKLVWEASSKNIAGQPPAYKAGGMVDGKMHWLMISSMGGKKYTLAITEGMAVKQVVEQSDGLLRRSDLGKLYAILDRGSDI